ncbi:alpha/beta hydrolase [uncultured Polaribacter sp.]|uniref:alpha/beta hydrolase n=1 Tax=uncultured Polaribacter sp. TaxID=174711 RepID=UPI0026389204|nr:alpha/beta hydrolase [uncultured Polaribacter sp.]
MSIILLYIGQEHLIFLNRAKLDKNYKYSFKYNFEELFLQTAPNTIINALHFKHKEPKGVILFFHGNEGNLKKWGNKVSFLMKYNYDVLVYDYRKYGKSTGVFNEEGMYTDALKVYDYLKNTYLESEIVLYGFSMGTTFATRVAAKNKPKELILEAPFYSLSNAVQYKFKLKPYSLLKYKFNTFLYLPDVICPVSLFHGILDKTTAFKDSKALYQLTNSENKTLLIIEQGTHHNLKEFKTYKEKLEEILLR